MHRRSGLVGPKQWLWLLSSSSPLPQAVCLDNKSPIPCAERTSVFDAYQQSLRWTTSTRPSKMASLSALDEVCRCRGKSSTALRLSIPALKPQHQAVAHLGLDRRKGKLPLSGLSEQTASHVRRLLGLKSKVRMARSPPLYSKYPETTRTGDGGHPRIGHQY